MALKVDAVQLNLEGLLKLLGGTANDRLRFWEIIKGITSVAEGELITHNLNTISALAKQTTSNLKGLQATAAKINKRVASGKNVR
jgi:hypothetical protein